MTTQQASSVSREATSSPFEARRIMTFEFDHGGHRPGYLLNLARFWDQQSLPGSLDMVVSSTFAEAHANVLDEVAGFGNDHIRFHTTESPGYGPDHQHGFVKLREGWKLFCQYATELHADHAHFMDIDFYQVPALIGSRPPCSFSGIYFRPTFHYPSFDIDRPNWIDRIKAVRKKWVLNRVLRHPQLTTLFSLDPFAVDYIQKHLSPKANVLHLPEPVQEYERDTSAEDAIRRELTIEEGRKIFMLFGHLDRRKGILELLEACQSLDAKDANRIAIVLAGPIHAPQREAVSQGIAAIRENTSVQIVTVDRFIEDRLVQSYLRISDVVLVTYQKHTGMSAMIVRAATADRPVLASDYGLVGELVRRRKLGMTIDSTDPAAIKTGLETCLNRDASELFDRAEARRFANENTATRAAETLWGTLLSAKA